MGYITKKGLIEAMRSEGSFSQDVVGIIDNLITTDKIRENEAVMDSHALNELDKNGLREKFLKFCEDKGFFHKWVENVQKGID